MVDDASRRWVASMPEAYDRWLVPTVFQPFADDLARRVAARPTRRVLEVAAGSGVLTRALLAGLPDAEVVATDLSEGMVQLGARRAPGATWRQADALALPFIDGAFDVVVCQFGVMFFPDRVRGLRELGRVAGGGRVLFSVWDVAERHAFGGALQAGVVRAHPDDPPSFVLAIPHGYADVAVIAQDLDRAGLDLTGLETITLEGRAPSVADVAAGFCTGTPLRGHLEARGDLDRAVGVVAAEMEALLGPGPVAGPMTAHVVEARGRLPTG